MEFFHISDLHIGKQLHFYSLLKEQEQILNEIAEYAQKRKPQAIVIAGDVYDKSVPSAEAVAVFNRFLKKLSELQMAVLIISGNHDSPERLDFASFLLEKENLYIAGNPPLKAGDTIKKVMLKDEYGPVCFWLLPFLRPAYLQELLTEEERASYTSAVGALLQREERNDSIRNVLVSHQFFTAAGREPLRSDSETVYVGGVGNVDVSVAEEFDYVAMGHIHRGQSVGGEKFCYCGTPLKYSAGESKDEKYLLSVTLGKKGEPPVKSRLPLHPVHDVKQLKGSFEELLKMGCTDYVSLTMTDEILPYQPLERLEQVFPNLLEIKIENTRILQQSDNLKEAEITLDPVALFGQFYEEIHGIRLDEKQKQIMQEITEKAKEEIR